MNDRGRRQLERGLSLGLSALAALIALTCASQATLSPSARSPALLSAAGAAARDPGQGPGTGRSGAGEAGGPAGTSSGLGGGASTVGSSAAGQVMSGFFRDLAGLEAGTRREMVRILWFGDSHTAADFLTGTLRARLQQRFGAGGPGFVRVGVKAYRHAQVHWSCDGPWKIEPVPPPRRALFDDGVFGLGGMRAFPAGGPAQASFELSPGAVHGRLHWQVWFSLKDGASFRLTLGGASQVVTAASPVQDLPGAGFVSLAAESNESDKLELVTLSGSPRFYGLIAESSQPGVVLDAVGIDGARLATALAWGESSFAAAVRARAPSLIAFAFGTNEAFDADKIAKYRAQYRELLRRARLSLPELDCLIVGLPDALAVGGGSEPRVAELSALQRSVAAELGCGFASQLQIMGGPGGYARWAHQSPQLASGDRLHLLPKGYELIGNAIADQLLAAYENRAR